MEPSCVSYYYPDHLPDLGIITFYARNMIISNAHHIILFTIQVSIGKLLLGKNFHHFL